MTTPPEWIWMACQRLAEVPGGQAPQVEHAQDLGDLRGAAHVWGQDAGTVAARRLGPSAGHYAGYAGIVPAPTHHLPGAALAVPDGPRSPRTWRRIARTR